MENATKIIKIDVTQILEVLCLISTVVGIFFHVAWGIVAFIASYIIIRRLTRTEESGFLKGAIDLNSPDAPPGIKEKMLEVIELLKKDGKLGKEKCDDPHCTTCHGFAEED